MRNRPAPWRSNRLRSRDATSGYTGYPRPLDKVIEENFQVDLSEEDREGDEMSGDEHSGGLQGGEPDIEHQRHIETGLPGDRTEHEEMETRGDQVSDEKKDIPRDPEKRKIA